MRKMWLIIVMSVALVALSGCAFLGTAPFGSKPKGSRLERIRRSPNYRQGAFRNQEPTLMMAAGQQKFPPKAPRGVPSPGEIKTVRTNLHTLLPDNQFVWFGHSSYLLQLGGVRYLVDPVFYAASPVGFINKPFPEADIYKPQDMPDTIDYLVITHDHYDHLDYRTVKELRHKVGKVICPLGVGAHLERWGYDNSRLVELDWYESAPLVSDTIVCLPSRHFSGRSLKGRQTLWASFMLNTPSGRIFIGGDGGYDGRFARFRQQFGPIDLAIIENGQYDARWPQIHTRPDELAQVMSDLAADCYITVHHSKFKEANHPWDEPLHNELEAARLAGTRLVVAQIGEPVHVLIPE
ncbi:MAG: MBL fold metallo-hydrolase [Bacteroidales bacterium]|nr:MBL fold metallo-hydrolase [Candidatus Colimorpha merdihippi]